MFNSKITHPKPKLYNITNGPFFNIIFLLFFKKIYFKDEKNSNGDGKWLYPHSTYKR